MNITISCENLNFSYNKKNILNDLSFDLSGGTIVGLLGPNGSGKTTLIKILAGILQSYEGSVQILGHQPGVFTKERISFLPDETYLNLHNSAMDNIKLFEDFYNDFDRNKAQDILKYFNLDLNQKLKTMSKGMQEKVQIALVMSRNAKIYLLDEPISGVDPASRTHILDMIINNLHKDSLLLLSTHLVSDIETILDRVIFLKEGEIILDDSAENLRSENNLSIDQLFREVFKNVH